MLASLRVAGLVFALASAGCGTINFDPLDAGSDACVPRTCSDLRATCGSVPNGCGGMLQCGMCAAGMTCNASNRCEVISSPDVVTPPADATLPDVVTPPSDATLPDSRSADSGVADACLPPFVTPDAGETRVQCAPQAGPTGNGTLLTDNFWQGFRFEVVGASVDMRRIGLELGVQDRYVGRTIFAAIVRLTGPTDVPDRLDLTASDVLTRVLITTQAYVRDACAPRLLPGVPSAPIAGTLAPGWYAAVFGTGAFGASLGAGVGPEGVVPNSPINRCSSRPTSTTFVINRSRSELNETPLGHHYFVDVSPR